MRRLHGAASTAQPVRSCLMLAVQADGHEITTVEGLAARTATSASAAAGDARPSRPAMRLLHARHSDDHDGVPRRERPHPSEAQIREALSGNLCRCTGYQHIVDAMLAAANGCGAERHDARAISALRSRRNEDARLLTRPGAVRRRRRASRHAACRVPAQPGRACARSARHRRLARRGSAPAWSPSTPPTISATTGSPVRCWCRRRRSPGIVFNQRTQVPLARDKVRHVGEPLAVVVAESRYLAEDALDDIAVELEPLPAVVDLEAALARRRRRWCTTMLGSTSPRTCAQTKGDYAAARGRRATSSSGAVSATTTARRRRSRRAAWSRSGTRAPTS